jgi:hypothetical protein
VACTLRNDDQKFFEKQHENDGGRNNALPAFGKPVRPVRRGMVYQAEIDGPGHLYAQMNDHAIRALDRLRVLRAMSAALERPWWPCVRAART